MKVLVIGSGGREHAVCRALCKSSHVKELLCVPGNAGIAEVARCFPEIKATDLDGVCALAQAERVDFVVVTPDDPLALGLADRLRALGIPAFGPSAGAARIESSKSFAKQLMRDYGVPTAAYADFDDLDAALAYLDTQPAPIVVKADGLALGKGVVIAQTTEQAKDAVRGMMRGARFGTAGSRVVIEECMTGPEVTLLCFCDGQTVTPMLSSQDHKRALDGDAGLNTGGMGAFAPSPKYTPEIARQVEETILAPTLHAIQGERLDFRGVLYVGLMLTPLGPRVVEYNARFGDPETQPLLQLLETDLMEILMAVEQRRLAEVDIRWKPGSAACVVLASGGYPEAYETGKPITGIERAEALGAVVDHAGTAVRDGQLVTAGGRVLGVTCTAGTLEQAVRQAYAAAGEIHFEGLHMRRDIGRQA